MPRLSSEELAARVMTRVVEDANGCLIWDGATAKGYGRIGHYLDGKQCVHQTHRVIWEAVHGPIPDGLTVEHRCTVRACQNVDHMELLTRGDNSRAGADRNSTVIENRAKTHCPRNHPYDDENTYTPPKGGRYCRECGRQATRRWREKAIAEGTHYRDSHLQHTRTGATA